MYDKTLKKETEKGVRRWNNLPCSWIGRINIVEIVILFFTELERTILYFTWENKKSRRVKTILNSKRTSGGITIPDLTL